jgi:lysophospholipase L1-like esterase
MPRTLLALALLVAVPAAGGAEDKFFLQDGQRVVFLGDSNTFAGGYVAVVDAFLFTRFPDKKFELLNLGLPSETVSGLSEPDHPYPRPDVHERLERVLARTKPDVVVVCYGMNDGIYSPFAEERFKKYQEGTRKLMDQATKAGAKVVLLTPLPFDPQPVKDKLQPKGAEKYSWLKPYEDYDDVLTRYSEWLLTLRDQGPVVADPHGAINRYLAAARKDDPKYTLAGDGIHPSATGHALAARELLRAWHAPADADAAEIDARAGKGVRGEVSDVAVEKGVVTFAWRTRLPLPHDPKWDTRLLEKEPVDEQLGRHRLTVSGLEKERYVLYEGETKLGEATRAELAAGVDLLKFKELSTNRRATEVWPLVEQRAKLLGLAWLTDVGHKRPDTPKGLALDEAQRQAAELEGRIRKLAAPAKLTLRLVPG